MKDVLGHDLQIGSIVVTTGYRTSRMMHVTKIVKINKKTVVVQLPYGISTTGNTYNIPIKRKPHQLIVIDKQVEHNKTVFPEAYI